MRKRILRAIKEGWYNPIFEGTLMSEFCKRILTIYNILDVFELSRKDTVALCGTNSYNWIAIYLACLLKGVRLLIIHPKEDHLEVLHVLIVTNANHIFIDPELMNKGLGRHLLLKTLISIDSLEVVFERTNDTHFAVTAKILTESEKNRVIQLKDFDAMFEDCNNDVSISSVITATSGTEFGYPKWVETNSDSITSLINKAIAIVPYHEMDTVLSKVEFAESHFVTVLLPFIKRCEFTGYAKDVNVIIESTTSIEKMWSNVVNDLHSNRFLSFLFTFSKLHWLFKLLAIRKIWNHYGRKLRKLIVYNSTMHQELLSTLIGNLPIYTTYGSQETNQLISINDFSSPEKRVLNAAGTALPGLTFNNNEDELEVSGSTLFQQYVEDLAYTNTVLYMDVYKTGDIGFFNHDTDVLHLVGRKVATHITEFKLPMQLDELERIVKSIPYVKEALLVPKESHLALLVYPDVDFAGIKGLGYLRTRELLRAYMKRINANLTDTRQISKVVLMSEPLLKTPDGKICRYFYS
jgi:long-subunit acyl-CoA synthetase (AMP-forming)